MTEQYAQTHNTHNIDQHDKSLLTKVKEGLHGAVEKVGLAKHQDQHTFTHTNQAPVPPAPVMKINEDRQLGSHEMPMGTISDKKDLGMGQLHGKKPICEPSELQNMKSTLRHRSVPETGLSEGVKAAFLHDREHRHKGLGDKIKDKFPTHHETGHLKGSEMGNVTGLYGMGHHERGFDETGHVTDSAGRVEGPLGRGHEMRTEGKHEIDSAPKKSTGRKIKEKLFGKKKNRSYRRFHPRTHSNSRLDQASYRNS